MSVQGNPYLTPHGIILARLIHLSSYLIPLQKGISNGSCLRLKVRDTVLTWLEEEEEEQ